MFFFGSSAVLKDKVGPNGSTPLFVAAKYDRLPAAQLLVQAGEAMGVKLVLRGVISTGIPSSLKYDCVM